MSDVLIVCTANECRSPMAEALLVDHFARVGVDASVGSAGTQATGRPVASGTARALRRRGLDLGDHESRLVDAEMMDDAGLVIGMERRHVRELVLLAPDAWSRTFTLKELVRRGEAAGRRRPGESAEGWLARVHVGRQLGDLTGRHVGDDIDDPMGGAAGDYERTAEELDALLGRLVTLLTPGEETSQVEA